MNSSYRHKLFAIFLLVYVLLSLVIKSADFINFLRNPLLIGDAEKRERILYGEDYTYIKRGLELPEDSDVMVTKKRLIANYYLYPRRFYLVANTKASREEILDFINKHHIEWIAIDYGEDVKFVRAEEIR